MITERDFLLLSASATGLGTPLSGYGYSKGMVWWKATANSASGELYASPHPDMGWFPISSFAVGPGASGSAMLTGAYGHLACSATWISGVPAGILTVFAGWAK